MTLAKILTDQAEYPVAAMVARGELIADDDAITAVTRAVIAVVMMELAAREADLSGMADPAERPGLWARMMDYQDAATELAAVA